MLKRWLDHGYARNLNPIDSTGWRGAGHETLGARLMTVSELDLKASELVLELESIGRWGTGHFAGLLVERRPELAKALYGSLQVAFEEQEGKA